MYQICKNALKQNSAYARKVKLSNLQQMAKTVAYIQEHGYNTESDLKSAFPKAKPQTNTIRKTFHSNEQKLKEINRQTHYTGCSI